jgi:hypothetical protein
LITGVVISVGLFRTRLAVRPIGVRIDARELERDDPDVIGGIHVRLLGLGKRTAYGVCAPPP